MFRKQLSEIIKELDGKTTAADKIKILRDNDSSQLRKFLELWVHHSKSFVFNKPIVYKPSDVPVNMGYTDTLREVDKLYLFLKDHPKTPPSLSLDKKVLLATMTLESMDAAEADVFHRLITNTLIIKGLNNKVLSSFDPSLAKQA